MTNITYQVGGSLNTNGMVWMLTFSPDSKLLACASGDGIVKVWQQQGTSWENPKLLHTLEGINTDPLEFACDFVRDYLRTNADVKQEDRHLCDAVGDR